MLLSITPANVSSAQDDPNEFRFLRSVCRHLAEGLEAFFCLPVKLMPEQLLPAAAADKRHNACTALGELRAHAQPLDAFCFAGLTAAEMTPSQAVNGRMAVFSLGRLLKQVRFVGLCLCLVWDRFLDMFVFLYAAEGMPHAKPCMRCPCMALSVREAEHPNIHPQTRLTLMKKKVVWKRCVPSLEILWSWLCN